jgi:hypothetical protein
MATATAFETNSDAVEAISTASSEQRRLAPGCWVKCGRIAFLGDVQHDEILTGKLLRLPEVLNEQLQLFDEVESVKPSSWYHLGQVTIVERNEQPILEQHADILFEQDATKNYIKYLIPISEREAIELTGSR